MDSEFSNETRFVGNSSLEVEVLSAGLFVRGKVLINSPEICIPEIDLGILGTIPRSCCCAFTLAAPDANISVGPVLEESVPILSDSARVNPDQTVPWAIAGFSENA